MKHYLKPDNSIWAFEADGSQDHLITADMTPLTDAQLAALRYVPSAVPQVVSRFQARAALLAAGLLDLVQTLMDAPETPALTKLAWDDAQEFRRTSPTVLSLGALLGLDDEALDNLFTAAAQIEA